MLASLTYFISAGERGGVCSSRGEGEGQAQAAAAPWTRERCFSLRRHHLDHRCFRTSDPDQAKRFVSVLFLCCHFIRGWVSALSLLPA